MFNHPNHMLEYRPLIGGVGIYNPVNALPGTLGVILTDGTNQWILSAYHVLGRSIGTAANGEPIFQPFGVPSLAAPVASLDLSRSDPLLDYATAAVLPGVLCDAWILGVGRPIAPIPPAVGMRVLKSGIRTGITQGVITAVGGTGVVIEAEPAFPSKYDLCSVGDSGSVWVEAATRAPVALHQRGQEGLNEVAFGLSLQPILNATGLSVLI